jgi:hypothetical protein
MGRKNTWIYDIQDMVNGHWPVLPPDVNLFSKTRTLLDFKCMRTFSDTAFFVISTSRMCSLKGQCHEIFNIRFFLESSSLGS